MHLNLFWFHPHHNSLNVSVEAAVTTVHCIIIIENIIGTLLFVSPVIMQNRKMR